MIFSAKSIWGAVALFSATSFTTAFSQFSSISETSYIQSDAVTIRLLDKVVGRSTDMEILANSPVQFASLQIELKACFYRPPELPPENAAFLKVHSTANEGIVLEEPEEIFSGWMFGSSPGLNALEHPVYDVWVIACKATEPEIGTE